MCKSAFAGNVNRANGKALLDAPFGLAGDGSLEKQLTLSGVQDRLNGIGTALNGFSLGTTDSSCIRQCIGNDCVTQLVALDRVIGHTNQAAGSDCHIAGERFCASIIFYVCDDRHVAE